MRWLALVFGILIAARCSTRCGSARAAGCRCARSDRQLAVQREANAKLKARNDALDADVRDLKTGSEAIEERARAELGMIRQDEVFFQMQTGGAGVNPQPRAARNAAADIRAASLTFA